MIPSETGMGKFEFTSNHQEQSRKGQVTLEVVTPVRQMSRKSLNQSRPNRIISGTDMFFCCLRNDSKLSGLKQPPFYYISWLRASWRVAGGCDSPDGPRQLCSGAGSLVKSAGRLGSGSLVMPSRGLCTWSLPQGGPISPIVAQDPSLPRLELPYFSGQVQNGHHFRLLCQSINKGARIQGKEIGSTSE